MLVLWNYEVMMDHTSFPQAKIVCIEVEILVGKQNVFVIFIIIYTSSIYLLEI
jgi:hypothetical protein